MGASIFVTIEVTPSRYKPGETNVTVTDAQHLEDVKGKLANTLTITIDCSHRDEDIPAIVKEAYSDKNPCRAGDLFVQILDSKGEMSPMKMHARKRFPITREIIHRLESTELPFQLSSN